MFKVLKLHEAMEAGCRLRRKLSKEDPSLHVYYGGCKHQGLAVTLTVYVNRVPDNGPVSWAGFPVEYRVRDYAGSIYSYT